jgi:cell division transport system permease protein
VVLAARAGLEAHRATIEVMHMLGSTDVQIARLFQRRIALDAAVGGIAGGVTALAVIALLGARTAALGSELLGEVALSGLDWTLVAALPFAFVLLGMGAARVAVTRELGRTL